MSFFRGNETVVIKRRTLGSPDEFGNVTYVTSSITVKNCFLGFSTTDEPIDAKRDPVDVAVTIYFPNGTKIEDGDTFVVRGTDWVKNGSAQQWENPFGMDAGVIVKVRKRNG